MKIVTKLYAVVTQGNSLNEVARLSIQIICLNRGARQKSFQKSLSIPLTVRKFVVA